MTATPWQRLSVRLGAVDPDEAPYEGVPTHLLRPLQRWVYDLASEVNGHVGETISLRLRIAPVRGRPADVLRVQEGMDLLDVVDAMLWYLNELGLSDERHLGDLRLMLDDAGSAYRISDDQSGLEVRITPAVREAVKQAKNDAAAAPSSGSAADHLATAWAAAYSLHPDPVRAYGEAIKAVESAAHAVIQPNHSRATLGTMLGEIGNARSKFTTVIQTPAGNWLFSNHSRARLASNTVLDRVSWPTGRHVGRASW